MDMHGASGLKWCTMQFCAYIVCVSEPTCAQCCRVTDKNAALPKTGKNLQWRPRETKQKVAFLRQAIVHYNFYVLFAFFVHILCVCLNLLVVNVAE